MTDTVSRAAALDEAAVQGLAATFRGQLLRPGDAGYDPARVVWNGMIDRKPALIARCAGAADVIAAVNFARENGLLVSVKGGGHSVSGAAVVEDGLMIDLTPMKSVRVDPKARTARAEPGVNWGEFDAETQAFGLAMTGGQISHTGIAGLTVGGGVGWLMRKCGTVVDNLLSADVVTADGTLLTASAVENEDLFWAIRGGGGNFGIVTSFEYRLHPIGPIVVGGLAGFEIERVREILEFYREFVASAPDELAPVIAFVCAPPLPFIPEHLHFKPIVMVGVCHCGPIEQGMSDVAPIQALDPAFNVIGPMPYTVVQRLIDESSPYGERRYYMKAGFLDDLNDDVIEALLTYGSAPSSPLSTILLVALRGAASRVDVGATAYAHRAAAYDFTIFPGWIDPAEDEIHIAWTRALFNAVRPNLHGVYVNAVADDGLQQITEAYPPETYARLVEVKNTYDPTNFFRLNQNIKPTVQVPPAT